MYKTTTKKETIYILKVSLVSIKQYEHVKENKLTCYRKIKKGTRSLTLNELQRIA